ncbi:MAG: nucleotidyltransferase family protein [Nitrospirae bacterium]|nr:nucleotidyltransferase family protein [Nitrospirota bacterium]
MDAIILAGGKGTRLRKIVSDVPKPLAPINGVPFLDLLLLQLEKYHLIKKVVLAVGYKSEMIIGRYRNSKSYNFKIDFSVEKELLGTGGAIKKAISLVGSRDVLVLNGDTFVDINFEELNRFHQDRGAMLTIVLRKMDDSKRYGTVIIDKKHRILAFEEKQDGQSAALINAGIYIINRSLFDKVIERELSFEKDLLPHFIKHDAYGYISKGYFIDIGVPETYSIAGEYLRYFLKKNN